MKWLKYLLFGGLLALAANFEVQAQVMVDMSKFTCRQLLERLTRCDRGFDLDERLLQWTTQEHHD